MISPQPAFLAALERLFTEGATLVFWNDPDGEFSAQVDALSLDGVRIARLDVAPALQVKIWIEREAGARWLIYAPFAEPEPEKDWLLDARLRGKPFSADTASMQLDELGLGTASLRDHLKLRAKFLRAKDRFDRLPDSYVREFEKLLVGGIASWLERARPSSVWTTTKQSPSTPWLE